MNKALIVTFGIALATTLTSAQAQIYQWKDSAGKTVISDSPPPAKAKGARNINDPSAFPENTIDAQPSLADRAIEFKKRQQEAKERAEKQAKEESSAREKQEHCDQARRNIGTLESGQRLIVSSENGEQQLMDGSQREQEIERLSRQVSDLCK